LVVLGNKYLDGKLADGASSGLRASRLALKSLFNCASSSQKITHSRHSAWPQQAVTVSGSLRGGIRSRDEAVPKFPKMLEIVAKNS
jgi:hypothetical protein